MIRRCRGISVILAPFTTVGLLNVLVNGRESYYFIRKKRYNNITTVLSPTKAKCIRRHQDDSHVTL